MLSGNSAVVLMFTGNMRSLKRENPLLRKYDFSRLALLAIHRKCRFRVEKALFASANKPASWLPYNKQKTEKRTFATIATKIPTYTSL